jgi:hypothetical protein
MPVVIFLAWARERDGVEIAEQIEDDGFAVRGDVE